MFLEPWAGLALLKITAATDWFGPVLVTVIQVAAGVSHTHPLWHFSSL